MKLENSRQDAKKNKNYTPPRRQDAKKTNQ